MQNTIKSPGGGRVTIEVRPAGTRRNNRDERVKVYEWSCNAFLGQHGEPFGTITADNIEHAYQIAQMTVLGRLGGKLAYEQFHETGR